MKQFMAIFLGSKTSPRMQEWQKLDEAAREKRGMAGMQAWGQWMKTNEKSVVFNGSPLGKTKKVGPNGISDISNEMSAFVVVSAETHEDAAKMFIKHPHFTEFPGEGVEVMECLPIPTAPKK